MELADRFNDAGVTVNASHPGFVPGSGLYRHTGPLFRAAVTAFRTVPVLGTNVEEAAEGLVYLADSEAVTDTTGAYFDGTREAEPDASVHDPEQRSLIWSVCAALTGVDPKWP